MYGAVFQTSAMMIDHLAVQLPEAHMICVPMMAFATPFWLKIQPHKMAETAVGMPKEPEWRLGRRRVQPSPGA